MKTATRLDEPAGLMSVYTERAHLVALLARIYRSHAYMASDAEPGFTYAICIHFPWGQASWHVADDDFRGVFNHIEVTPSDYDGHTTAAKYEAMRKAIADHETGLVREKTKENNHEVSKVRRQEEVEGEPS